MARTASTSARYLYMIFKFFIIPMQESRLAEDELNAFLRSHRILSIDRHVVDGGGAAFWAFCVQYVDGPELASGNSAKASGRGDIDYRKLLSEEDFAVYAELRDLRKQLAQVDGVPPYQVFNNRQLAEMVRKKMRTEVDLRSLPGVGDARLEKYGARFLATLLKIWDGPHEAEGKSV
jgi:superfamily II DNA helicase RecQ